MSEPATWTALVAKGKAAVAAIGDAKWELGDLALRVEAMGEKHVHTGSGDRLDAYADEIDINPWRLKEYRKVASAWPDGARAPSASWSVHRVLQYADDRFALIKSRSDWTADKASEFLYTREAEAQLEKAQVTAGKAAAITDPPVRFSPLERSEDEQRQSLVFLDGLDVAIATLSDYLTEPPLTSRTPDELAMIDHRLQEAVKVLTEMADDVLAVSMGIEPT